MDSCTVMDTMYISISMCRERDWYNGYIKCVPFWRTLPFFLANNYVLRNIRRNNVHYTNWLCWIFSINQWPRVDVCHWVMNLIIKVELNKIMCYITGGSRTIPNTFICLLIFPGGSWYSDVTAIVRSLLCAHEILLCYVYLSRVVIWYFRRMNVS